MLKPAPPLLPLKRVRTSQPQGAGGSRIDWGNGLTRGLVFASNFALDKQSIYSVVGQKTVTSSVTKVAKGKGVEISGAFYFYGSTGDFDSVLGGAFSFTFAFTYANFVNSGSSINVIGGYTSAAAQNLSIVTTSSNVIQVWVDQTIPLTSPVLTAGKSYVITVGRDSSGSAQMWLNGVLVSTATGASQTITGSSLCFLDDGSGVRNFKGSIAATLIHNVAPHVIGKSLSDNPWQIFAQDPAELPAPLMPREVFAPVQSKRLGTTGQGPATAAIAGVRRSVRTSQPQDAGGSRIDRSSSLGARVIDAFVGPAAFTAAGKPIVKAGTVGQVAYSGGVGYKNTASAGFSIASNLSAQNAITIVFEFVQYSRSGSQVLFEHSPNQNTNAGTFILYTDSATNRFAYGQSSGGSYDAGYVTPPTIGKKCTVAIRLRFTAASGNADVAIAVDGVLQTTTNTNTSAGVINFGGYSTYFLARAGTSLHADATVGMYAVLSGFGSDVDLVSLSANPYQIFLPDPQKVWVPA